MRFDALIPKMASFFHFGHRKWPKMAKNRRKSPRNRQTSPKIAENLRKVKLWVCIWMCFDALIPKMTSFLNFDHQKGLKMVKNSIW